MKQCKLDDIYSNTFPAWEVTLKMSWLEHCSPHLHAPQNMACKSRCPLSHPFWPDQLEMAASSDLQKQREASEHLQLESSTWNLPCSDCSPWFLQAASIRSPSLPFQLLQQSTGLLGQECTRASSWLLGSHSSASVCSLVLWGKD